jgi:hypothetical protein
MPQVFTNDMVSHVWAQQSQQSGRSANGQFYFEGPFLYSYGTHYIAGLFAAVGGPVFINADSNSMTTNRHRSRAWSAARHLSPWHVPGLTDVARYLRDAGQDRLTADKRKRLVEYLAGNWQSFAPDSEAAAWILAKAGKRGTWAAMRARLESAKARKDAADKARAKAHAIREGRTWAARTWPEVRDRFNREADAYGQRGLADTLADIRAARLATPKAHKRVRATLWSYETKGRAILARAKRDSDRWGNPGERVKASAAIAKLRQFVRGRLGGQVPGFEGPDGPGKFLAALELPNGAGFRTLATGLREVLAAPCVRLPWAKREALTALASYAADVATVREGEAEQRRKVSYARQELLRRLSGFNRGRRAYRAALASGYWSGPTPVDPVTGGSYAPMTADQKARTLDSILSNIPDAMPWALEQAADAAPGLVARARAIHGRALAIAAELEPVRDEYRTEAERERAAARQAERERQQRFAAMSADELRAAFEAGELRARDSILWSVTRETGPLLRAVAPEVSGCSVTGGTLETSEGATVPLRHAFRVFQFVALCRAERKTWTPGCGFGPGRIRVGHFTLDRIDSTGNFVAGCHSIKWPEVERLARGLGVADCLAPVAEVTAELTGQAA